MRTALDFSQALSPFNELSVVRDLIEPWRDSMTRAGFHPACDIEETESDFLVSFDIPGVAKEDVKIELEDNELRVSGERHVSQEASDARGSQERKRRFHFAERTLGKFQRVFTLPMAVQADGVKARFADGVLHVTLPKAEAAKPKRIQIES